MKNIVLILFFMTLTAQGADVNNWPAWRGPSFNGVSEAKDFPEKWSQSENIAWKIALPGGSGSTPIVWHDNIFITTNSEDENLVICFDHNGNKKWEQPIGKTVGGKHRQKGSGAHPSPTTDGSRIYVYYRSQDLACLDFEGKIVWQKNLQNMYGKDTLYFDLAASPVLTQDLVVIACMRDEDSYLAAFNKLNGEVVWKQARNMNAPRESDHSYTTPVVLTEGENQTIYVLGADHVTAHNAQTGEEIWRAGGLNPKGIQNFRSISSPVVLDGILVAPYARGRTLTAIHLGGSGDVTDTHIAWTNNEVSSDVPSPAAKEGKIYICTDRGKIACLDIKTGREIWSGEMPDRATFSSSPVLADGRIYVTSEAGTTYILEQGDEFELLGANELGEFTLATPVFTRNHILIKTYENLYSIGK